MASMASVTSVTPETTTIVNASSGNFGTSLTAGTAGATDQVSTKGVFLDPDYVTSWQILDVHYDPVGYFRVHGQLVFPLVARKDCESMHHIHWEKDKHPGRSLWWLSDHFYVALFPFDSCGKSEPVTKLFVPTFVSCATRDYPIQPLFIVN